MSEELIQAVEIDCETGIETYRPLTTEELAAREEARIAWEAQQTALKAEQDRIAALKESARAKLISGQPLTEEEAAVIVL